MTVPHDLSKRNFFFVPQTAALCSSSSRVVLPPKFSSAACFHFTIPSPDTFAPPPPSRSIPSSPLVSLGSDCSLGIVGPMVSPSPVVPWLVYPFMSGISRPATPSRPIVLSSATFRSRVGSRLGSCSRSRSRCSGSCAHPFFLFFFSCAVVPSGAFFVVCFAVCSVFAFVRPPSRLSPVAWSRVVPFSIPIVRVDEIHLETLYLCRSSSCTLSLLPLSTPTTNTPDARLGQSSRSSS